MEKYPKRAMSTRAERRGLSPSIRDIEKGVSPKDIDKMEDTIRNILENSHKPDDSELALLEQFSLMCQRVIAFKEWGPSSAQTNRITAKIARHDNVLHKHNFSTHQHIIPLNLWVTRRLVHKENELYKLLKMAQKKMPEETKKEKEGSN